MQKNRLIDIVERDSFVEIAPLASEPTSALGVHQTATVLRYINMVRARGLSVIFITHNVHHAFAVGDAFTVLNRGRTLASWSKGEVTIDDLQSAMAGGRALQEISRELDMRV